MASNYTPSSLSSGYRSTEDLNNEFQEIKDSMDRLLSREGDAPNQMEVDLDMNSKKIINVGAPVDDTSAVRLGDINGVSLSDTSAALTDVVDTQGHYASNNVEGALEEIGNDINSLEENKVEIVDSVSDLQSGSFESGLNRIWLSGYYGAGTPGGGPLYRDSGDTTTADNGGTVFVDADGVRWKRQEKGLINVTWFGAIGDGDPANTSSNNTAIQSAIDEAEDRGGGIIFVPAGVYITDTVLTITKTGVSLLGEGSSQRNFTAGTGSLNHLGGSEIINRSATNGEYALDIVLGTRGSEGYANLFVRDLTVGVSDNGVHGVRVLGCQRVMFDNVRIVYDKNGYDAGNEDNIGLNLDDAIVSTFRHCDFRFFSVGIQSEALFNENVVERCNFEFLGSVGIRIRNLTGVNSRGTIRECNFRTTKRAVQITGECEGQSVVDNTFESLSEYGVLVDRIDVVDAADNGLPQTVSIERNLFINVGNTGNFGIIVNRGSDIYCGRNFGRSSPTGQTALIQANNDSDLILFGNTNDNSKPVRDPASGDLRWRVLEEAYRDTAPNGSSVPDTEGANLLFLTNSTATDINSLTGGFEGKVVTLYAQGNNSTIKHANSGAGDPDILLNGSVDFAMAAQNTVTLIYGGGTWFEIGRKS